MKVLQLSVNVEFFAVVESGENSKKAIIIPYGPGNTTVPPIVCPKAKFVLLSLKKGLFLFKGDIYSVI